MITLISIVIGLSIGIPMLLMSARQRREEFAINEAAASEALTQHLRGSK